MINTVVDKLAAPALAGRNPNAIGHMRILLTTDAVGGVWRYSATLARALAGKGHAVLLAVIGAPTGEQLSELPDGIEVERRDFKLEWQSNAEGDLTPTAAWLVGLERSWHPDVLHLNQMTYTGLVTFEAPTVVVVHSDVCSWYSEVRGAPAPADWLPYRQLVRVGLQSATRVVAPSRYQGSLIDSNYGPLAVSVIHNGVDPVPPRAGEKDHEVDSDELRVLTVGRAWDEAKGVRTLDDALLKMGEAAPEAHLIGALDEPTEPTWFPRRLVWEGELSGAETARWMHGASVYVAPSLYEPFGLAPVEAALNGCALVLSDIGSFRELWDGRAEFFERGNPAALASTLEALCRRPERVRQLATSAQAWAAHRYGTDRFADDYLTLYSGLVRDAQGQARGSLAGASSA